MFVYQPDCVGSDRGRTGVVRVHACAFGVGATSFFPALFFGFTWGGKKNRGTGQIVPPLRSEKK